MQTDQQSTLNSLKDEGPEAWRAYLRSFEEGQSLTGLSMLVIFHHIAPKAKKLESVDWAEVAVRAIELEALHHSGVERDNSLVQAMRLRAWFIAKMGSRPNNYVLDKEIILRWVTEVLDMPVHTAKEKAVNFWKDVARLKESSDPEDRKRVHDGLKHLNRIKRRLDVVRVLADGGGLPNDSILNQWLEIRKQLP